MPVDLDRPTAVLEGLSTDIVLVVDLDGTLLSSDMLYETFWSAFGRDWTVPLRGAASLVNGRAALKRVLAGSAKVDVSTLPYNPAVIATVNAWRAQGGRVTLVTASDADLAQAIADYLGIFDEVHGSDGALNLKAKQKAEFLNQRYGAGRYAYMGDSAADLKVWLHAARAITVNASAAVRQALRTTGVPVSDLQIADKPLSAVLGAFRPAHGLLALLALLPLVIAHTLSVALVAQSLLALVCVALVSGGTGLMRDMMTLADERADRSRREGPFASGQVSLAEGSLLALALIVLSVAAALLSGPVLGAVTLGLLVVGVARGLLRDRPVLDSLLFAAQGTLALVAGAVATSITLSVWHAAFLAACLFAAASVWRLAPPEIDRTTPRAAGRQAGLFRYARLSVLLLCSGILMAPTVLNGAPFLYYDTTSYIWYPHDLAHAALQLLRDGTQSESLVIISGRSVYYGLFTYLSTALTNGWALVWAQATVLGWLVALSYRVFLPQGWIRASVLTAVGLATLTPAGFFVGLLTPDIWSGFLIIAAALLLAVRPRLSKGEIWALWAIVAFATLAHASHLALLLSMTALAAAALLIPRLRRHLSRAGVFALSGAIVVALAGQLALSALTKTLTGQPPLALPHITAHLVDLGPGTRLVQDTCPERGYAVCAFADRLPMSWVHFMFEDDPQKGAFWVAAPEVQRALVAEQVGFMRDVVAAYPLTTLGGLALDGLQQLGTLSVKDVPMQPVEAEYLAAYFQPALVDLTHASAMYSHPELRHLVTGLAYTSLVGTLLWSFALSAQAVASAPVGRDFGAGLLTVVAVVVACVLLNALICGILASPYGRFQARLIWLLPFAAMLMTAVSSFQFKTSIAFRRPIA